MLKPAAASADLIDVITKAVTIADHCVLAIDAGTGQNVAILVASVGAKSGGD